jgi:hypothetical protein
VGLDLKAHLEKYPEICKRKFGRTYNFSALEKRFVPLREGQRWLAARDVSHIFHPENTPFGRYWPQPNKKDLDNVLAAKRIGLGLNSQDRGDLVRNLLSVFHNVGVVSIILRFTHPDQFGVFSTPVLYLVQINRAATVDLYLAYCEELAAWAKRFGIPTIAETEMAIWSFAETIKDADTSKEAAAAARSFEDDLWIQRRRAAHIVGPFLRRHGRLQLARILLDEDHRLAGKIAADEYERLLGLASQRFRGRRLPAMKGAAEQLIDELEQKQKISLLEKVELRGVWETRNAAVHPGGSPPTRAAVEVMIDRIETICNGWEDGTVGKASGNLR